MDASHFLVGGLTAVSLALLIWIEVRSRRQAFQGAAQSRSEAHDRPAANSRKAALERYNAAEVIALYEKRSGSPQNPPRLPAWEE